MVIYSEEEFCFLWHSQKNHNRTAKLYADLVLFGQFVQMDVSKNLSTSMCSTIHPDILKPGIGRERYKNGFGVYVASREITPEAWMYVLYLHPMSLIILKTLECFSLLLFWFVNIVQTSPCEILQLQGLQYFLNIKSKLFLKVQDVMHLTGCV